MAHQTPGSKTHFALFIGVGTYIVTLGFLYLILINGWPTVNMEKMNGTASAYVVVWVAWFSMFFLAIQGFFALMHPPQKSGAIWIDIGGVLALFAVLVVALTRTANFTLFQWVVFYIFAPAILIDLFVNLPLSYRIATRTFEVAS